jgi:hypothetical protein
MNGFGGWRRKRGVVVGVYALSLGCCRGCFPVFAADLGKLAMSKTVPEEMMVSEVEVEVEVEEEEEEERGWDDGAEEGRLPDR